VGEEGNARTIRRPHRRPISVAAVRQVLLLRAIQVHAEDLEVASLIAGEGKHATTTADGGRGRFRRGRLRGWGFGGGLCGSRRGRFLRRSCGGGDARCWRLCSCRFAGGGFRGGFAG